jgi:hypothetical protein
MENEWEIDRMELYRLWQEHPDWTKPRLADALQRSLTWVKKWLKRFREAPHHNLKMFCSLSRAPHHRTRHIVKHVRDAILHLRDTLHEQYRRVVGPKPILYHLRQVFEERSEYVPRSTSTVWKILKNAGRITNRARYSEPLVRPEPMQHWELDFGQVSPELEFVVTIDRGTSILVNTHTFTHYNAETALQAVAEMLILIGCPPKLRFDNDPRLVGSMQSDGFPSAFMRFLHCLGIEPDIVPPGRPQDKPYVERAIRTVKHECLYAEPVEDWLAARGQLESFRWFYNHERAHQGDVCDNRPPFVAFPSLPTMPHVPDVVDPDAWLRAYHGRTFKRHIGQNGRVSVGTYDYYVGYALSNEKIGVFLDANERCLRFLHHGGIVRELEIQGLVGHAVPFDDYLKLMLFEARTADA